MKKKYILNFLAFLFPILIVLVSFIIIGKSYDKYVYISDLKAQYIGFFQNFQQVLKGKESILYSFSSGLGSNFLMDYFYYLGSPLNFLLIFFSTKNLLNGIVFLILVKCGLSSLTMSLYFKRYRISNYMILLLSLCYSLSSYFVSFYSNIMWLDSIILMPLILMSIEEFLYNGSKIKYIILTSILVISNYYISFFCFIFIFIYFTAVLFNKGGNIKEKVLKFIKINVLVLLLCSFVLVPTFINILNLSHNRGIDYIQLLTFSDRIKMLFNIFEQLFPFSSTSYDFSYTYVPNIYSSIFILLLCIGYFKCKDVSRKEKIISISIILIFIFSFLTNFGNYVFNGFSHPFGYHFRYSFLLSLFLIILSANYIKKNRINYLNFSKKSIIFINIFISVFLFFQFLINSRYNVLYFVFMLILVNSYFIIGKGLYKNKTEIFKKLLFLLVVLEIFLNLYDSMFFTSYNNINQTYTKIINNCQNNTYDHRYIYNNDKKSERNTSLLCSNKGSQYSSSNINYNVKVFYQKIGAFVSGSHYYLNIDNTNLIKKMLSVKYEEKQMGIYNEISNTLSVGYMVDKEFNENNILNPFEYQNKLVSNMIGYDIEPLKSYTKIDSISKDNQAKEKYMISNEKNIYFYSWHDTKRIVFPLYYAEVYVNKKLKFKYNGVSGNYGIRKIANENNRIINITVKKQINNRSKRYFNYYDISKNLLYYEDDEVVDYAISELSKNQLNITKMEKNILEGNINVEDKKILFLSIPYEEGWNIYVDGKKTNYFKIYDAFIGINLTQGHHEIKMVFYPKGLKEGIIISSTTLIVIIIVSLFKYRLKKGM